MVCGDEIDNGPSFRKLLYCLHDIEFIWVLDRDKSRAQDGTNFRYRFGYEVGYSDKDILRYIDNKPCSVLEMMVALAFRVEDQIMDDDSYGNRTGQWFWSMIVSLGLGGMDDIHFNEDEIRYVIDRFLHRRYLPSGRGGLFTLDNCKYDLREVEIWFQCMWYLNEINDS